MSNSSLGSKIRLESSKSIFSASTCASSSMEIIDEQNPPKAPRLGAMPDPPSPKI
tara:strand:+ start:475 stop:639 length:165 start_codon:yes stop_codon:yes gene_type:complete